VLRFHPALVGLAQLGRERLPQVVEPGDGPVAGAVPVPGDGGDVLDDLGGGRVLRRGLGEIEPRPFSAALLDQPVRRTDR
jgi:hypothetical protein